MRRPIAAALVAAVFVCGTARAQTSALVGVNVVNPQWRPAAEQEATLDALQRAGVTLIRVPLVPPTGGTYDGTVDYIARAAARGIRTLLIVYPLYRPGVPPRPLVPGEPEMWSLPPLSAASADVLSETYGPVLRRLDARGLKLAGLEFGNEINWTAFNGEFPIPGTGRVLGYSDLTDDPLGRRIAAGYAAFVRSAEALKRIRDGLSTNRDTPIVAGGLADFGPVGRRPGEHLDSVNVGATLRYLRVEGLDRAVDAYSIHVYPDAPDRAGRKRALDRDVLSECGGKPCWLTEWGVVDPATACPAEDAARVARIEEFRADVAPAVRDGRVRALVFYSWGGEGDPHGLVRCGGLTASGRAALAPLAP